MICRWFALSFLSLLALSAPAQTAESRVTVATAAELYRAVKQADRPGRTLIEIEDGVYTLPRTLRIDRDYTTLRSLSGLRDSVVLRGNGMRQTSGVDNLIEISAKHVSIVGLTLERAGNHLIQVRGERDADHFTLNDSVLKDGYEQLLKVSTEEDGEPSADFGVVQNTLFAYSDELGPNFYIGGIDLHSGKNWLIEGNTFRNIASPSGHVAEHAIHIWKNSADNVVRNNLIINSDRGIGFGLTKAWFRHNRGGEISNNIVIHTRPDDPFSDVGISLENSPDTLIRGNFIYLMHSYPNGIEYRFPETAGVIITANVTNKAITARDGAQALVEDNETGSLTATGIDYLRMAMQKLKDRLSNSD